MSGETVSAECFDCKKGYVYQVEIRPGFADFEELVCMYCDKNMRRVRCDINIPFLVETYDIKTSTRQIN